MPNVAEGERRFTAPESGWYDVTGWFAARPGNLVEMMVRPASMLDLPKLRKSIGEGIRVDGPKPYRGVLRELWVAEDESSARLTIEKDAEP